MARELADVRAAGAWQKAADGFSYQASRLGPASLLVVCQTTGTTNLRTAGVAHAHLPSQHQLGGTLSTGPTIRPDGQATTAASPGRLACASSTEFFSRTPGVCIRSEARLCCG